MEEIKKITYITNTWIQIFTSFLADQTLKKNSNKFIKLDTYPCSFDLFTAEINITFHKTVYNFFAAQSNYS